MNTGPSSFRGDGCSKFESLPDISRKLDTILQLLRNNYNKDTLERLASQQQEILQRLDQQTFSTQPCPVAAPQMDARSTLLRNQQWGPVQRDPVTTMSNGWNNTHTDIMWQQSVQPAEPITVPLENNRDQVIEMLRDIQRQLPVTSGRVTESGPGDINGVLFNLNEELGNLRESLAVKGLEQNLDVEVKDTLQQIYDTLAQLINQSNDNAEAITTLQGSLNDIYMTISHSVNNRQGDISRLIEENDTLRAYIQRLIDSIRNR